MASPAKVPNASSNKENAEGANVDKIRDILFGSQMRDYEKRFVRLEDTVTKALDTLREDMTKRLDTLGSFIRQEVDSLSTRLKSEKSERTEAFKEISREIKDGGKVIEKKLSQRRADVRRPGRAPREASRALQGCFLGNRQAAPRYRRRAEPRSGRAAR